MAGQRVHGSEIASAFASLRANDLVWNYVVSNYLKGETPPAFDLLYWNSDSANLPGPMYVYYLQNLYLDNLLREPGALTMDGERVDLSRIDIPATFWRRATITSCRGTALTGRLASSAAIPHSCWARRATSPAS
jgi:poly(3-hydroxyalkanoate) synthetase